jgi:hypothetical protein
MGREGMPGLQTALLAFWPSWSRIMDRPSGDVSPNDAQ